jgi:outer membrane biosynthesis protein TonB
MDEGNRHADELAAQAADAVRRVVTDAETRAAEIVREAETDAARIRDRAEADARERIEGARRALDELRGRLEQAPATPAAETPEPEPAPEPEPEPAPETEPPGAPEAPTSPPAEQPSESRPNGDDAAARLVAMKLAVDGRGREEIEAELTERFGAGDRSALLDDVLARAGG